MRLAEMIYTEEEMQELREENRLLKNEIAWLKDHTKYNGITKEYYIDWTMTATEAKLRLQQAEANQNYVSKLEEENKKLKSDLSLVIKERDDNIKVNEFFKKTNSELWNVIEWLKEQNKKLKSDLAFKNTMLDNVSAEYESSLNIIRKLNKRIKELEQCNLNLQTWIDNKEKVNKSLREENKKLSDFLECEA